MRALLLLPSEPVLGPIRLRTVRTRSCLRHAKNYLRTHRLGSHSASRCDSLVEQLVSPGQVGSVPSAPEAPDEIWFSLSQNGTAAILDCKNVIAQFARISGREVRFFRLEFAYLRFEVPWAPFPRVRGPKIWAFSRLEATKENLKPSFSFFSLSLALGRGRSHTRGWPDVE